MNRLLLLFMHSVNYILLWFIQMLADSKQYFVDVKEYIIITVCTSNDGISTEKEPVFICCSLFRVIKSDENQKACHYPGTSYVFLQNVYVWCLAIIVRSNQILTKTFICPIKRFTSSSYMNSFGIFSSGDRAIFLESILSFSYLKINIKS